MDEIAYQGLLFDFYGALLTSHQRQIYEDAVFNDMSLSEIADLYGISRQGVHDLLKRCDKILETYEEKLHLVERFSRIRKKMGEIDTSLDELIKTTGDEAVLSAVNNIKMLSSNILGEI